MVLTVPEDVAEVVLQLKMRGALVMVQVPVQWIRNAVENKLFGQDKDTRFGANCQVLAVRKKPEGLLKPKRQVMLSGRRKGKTV